MALSDWQTGAQRATAGWTGRGVLIHVRAGVWLWAWLIGRWGDVGVVRLLPVRGKPHRLATIRPERIQRVGHADPLDDMPEIRL